MDEPYKQRRPLCVKIKNARVRRMLNMDNLGDDPTSITPLSRGNDCKRSSTSSGQSKKEAVPYKGWTRIQEEPSTGSTAIQIQRNGDCKGKFLKSNFELPPGQSKKEAVSHKGWIATEAKPTTSCTAVHIEDGRINRNLSNNSMHAVEIEGVSPMYMNQENNTKKFTNLTRSIEVYEDFEEPFSPVVSEYIPESDSYDSSLSEENLERNKACKKNRNRKKLNRHDPKHDEITPSSKNIQRAAESDDVSLKPKLLSDPQVASNLKTVTPKSARHVASPVVTPCTSLVLFRKVSTPDSFKEILRAVQNKSLKNKLADPDNTVSAQYKDQQPSTQTQTNPKTKIDRNYLIQKHNSYEKFCFVASTSTVYIKGNFNEKHVEQDSSQVISTEIDVISIENDEEAANTDKEIPTQSPITRPSERQSSSTEIAFIAPQSTVHINNENFSEGIEPTTKERQSRKRVRDESSWSTNKNKLLKNSGQRYHSKATKTERREKIMGDPCACKKKCNEKIDNSERMLVFKSYWELASHERQWDYILRYVKGKPTRFAVLNSKRPRTQTLVYSLPKRNGTDTVTVCKKMFMQTLNINDRTVYTALEKQESRSIVDLRGQHSNRPIKISENTTKSVVDHINLFPRKESQYLRKQTQREYLDEKLNCAKMHRLYLDWIKNTPDYENVIPASERWYYHIFNTKFNIGFFHPKKDICDTCSLYEHADTERKIQLKEDYEKHVKNKELVRKNKEQEKETSDAKEKTVACFDLEKVLTLPQSEVGVFHYKRKYPVYNFTIYNILTKSGHCYVWHAQIAKRGANEIASCLWSFLQAESEKGITEISFYSDNCTGQNRNRFVFALYDYASRLLNIKITHRFLQKGHTQNEGDSMHSCIEKSKKNHVLYVPEEIYAIIRNAKVQGQKYNVKEMVREDFFDFKKLVTSNMNWVKDESGKKVNWTKIKEISVDPLSPGKLQIKYELDDEQPVILDTNRSGRVVRRKKTADSGNTERPIGLVQLYNAPLPIAENLYKDLISLCKGNHIPPHYHTFYKNLQHHQSAMNESSSEVEDNDL